jgi:hypothetical protein
MKQCQAYELTRDTEFSIDGGRTWLLVYSTYLDETEGAEKMNIQCYDSANVGHDLQFEPWDKVVVK